MSDSSSRWTLCAPLELRREQPVETLARGPRVAQREFRLAHERLGGVRVIGRQGEPEADVDRDLRPVDLVRIAKKRS